MFYMQFLIARLLIYQSLGTLVVTEENPSENRFAAAGGGGGIHARDECALSTELRPAS